MQKNRKGFLLVLCLCMLSVSGIFGVYQYQQGKVQEPEVKFPKETAQLEDTKIQEPEKEAANSEGTVAQADTEDKKVEEAKIQTEEDIYKIGEAKLAKREEENTQTAQESSANVTEEKFAFTEENTLSWPVTGDVILNYSMDKSIYFSTLNQYKYHPAIVIGAQVGTEVLSAARGTVSEITINEETGTTLTMDLGSGYQAIYGQLKEVGVQEGDVLEKGALLGYVGEPTKYYTLEGSNVYFQLLKDGEAVNPMEYLE